MRLTLQTTAAIVDRAQRELDSAKSVRDQTIVVAADAEWSRTEIAEMTGLSRGRVSQIIIQRKGSA